MSFVRDLHAPVLRLTHGEPFTLGQAFEGVQVFGGIGSGKTSGSGAALASAYLRAGFGGLVLCAKPDEVDLWVGYAKANGRLDSLIVFDENEGLNFLNYELARQGTEGVAGVVECLLKILDGLSGAYKPTGEDSGFWVKAGAQLLRYTVLPLYAAYGRVTLHGIVQFLSSAPTDPRQVDKDSDEGKSFKATSYAGLTLDAMQDRPVKPLPSADQQAVLNFWRHMWVQQIPQKTRGNIVITVAATLDRFQTGRLNRMFCEYSTLAPEQTFHGAIIVCAMPVLLWNEDGVLAQKLVKYLWQRAVLARNALDPVHRERPVFLWADESQYFVTPDDPMFLSAARSSRAAAVFLTQSITNYYAQMGGENGVHAAQQLIGMFKTKVFHNNPCMVTNTYASELLGKELKQRRSVSTNEGLTRGKALNSGFANSNDAPQNAQSYNYGSGGNWGSSQGRSDGYSEQMDFVLQPDFFASQLRSGGVTNKGLVDAIMYRAGAPFKNGSNDTILVFKQ